MQVSAPSNERLDTIQCQLPTGQLSFQVAEGIALELGFTGLVPALEKAEV